MNTEIFCERLKTCGFDFWAGVPCSYLKGIINWSIKNAGYIASVNEGDAVASCAGAFLGGAKPVVLMQNSGLTNALSPLTSLTSLYQIPLLGFVSIRADEPQHELMGSITESMLEMIKVQWAYLSQNTEEALEQITIADKNIENNKSFFFVIKKGTFDLVSLPESDKNTCNYKKGRISVKCGTDEMPQRRELLNVLCNERDPSTVFLSTTGYTSRELFETGDSPGNFYMLGSLGCVGSCALGLALQKPGIKVVAIDGDGSLLMRLGSLAVSARYAPSNLFHVLLDNGVHESTGSQKTVSDNTDFTGVAYNCGFPVSIAVCNIDQLVKEFRKWLIKPALTFIHLKTATGTAESLSRPRIRPSDISKRFRTFVKEKGDLS